MSTSPASLPGWPGEESPFHAGEMALQARAGLRERIEQVGRKVIRDFMPAQHRELFAQLPLLVAGSVDGFGRPWASLLCGPAGFVSSPDARCLRVQALPEADDPLSGQLAVDARLGLLGIQLETRRRNRMNGRVARLDGSGFTVAVRESFGNCPQYIQAREPRWLSAAEGQARRAPARPEGPRLSAEAQALVQRADTLFIASAAPGAGADVSHRGGRPGFVAIAGDGRGSVLSLPDYRGNFLFNTLGNLLLWPHAGLLFPDFDSGGLLQLTGRTEIVWDGPEVETRPGAQSLLRFHVEQGVWRPGALPLSWSAAQWAPQLQALKEAAA
ncbi:pyridoxamine 5'-phosphate oxidase family protein [Aquabacterium sp. A7-Y]|uniref:pyridoxamine 5'-phosphate oxidase family protein n=1 Tax=Aquabacterium sp. A7-Y TaxID=1349605 RepID=UPI00223CD5F4|nr:pyridoxamine 5'-phosphate oxidase family protein [Aquabacterium sp. A7-Y]MCW7538367.1 pyridoxamine 5'-phosphate oxidase family protein [Aquabacterium sp. A7-Y]